MKAISQLRFPSASILFVTLQLFSTASLAQGGPPPPEYIYNIDWNERLAPNLGLKAHDDSLMGDQIDLHTGRLSFEHVDVSLPGNSNLPVEIRRTLNPSQPYGHAFSDWQLSVPRISTNINGYEFSKGIRWGKARCSGSLVSAIPTSNSPKDLDSAATSLRPDQYSNGVNLDVPGIVSTAILDKSTNGSWPSVAQKVTAKDWYLTCIANIDGAGTEGFYAIAPNGNRYRFDKIQSRKVSEVDMWKFYPGLVIRHDREQTYLDMLLVSEITDVNGNWVRYSYDSSSRLTSITANDGRRIDLIYGGTKIDSIIANLGTADERRWTYTYGGSAVLEWTMPTVSYEAPTKQYKAYYGLKSVTLPDGRSWQFNLAGVLAKPISGTSYETRPIDPATGQRKFSGVWAECKQEPQTISLTHPDGVTGEFKVEEKGRFLPVGANSLYGAPCPKTMAGNNLNTHQDLMAVVSKKLSASGVTTALWNYGYANGYDGSANPNPDGINKTTVVYPDGTKTINYYNAPGADSSLIKRELFQNNVATTPLEKTEYSYLYEAAAGSTFLVTSDASHKPLRQTEIKITRGDDWYRTRNTFITDRNAANYSYGNPVTIEQWSSGNNGTRTTSISYTKDADDWVIGLPDTITKNGKLFDDYDWDSKGRLITHKQFGVTLAELTYHTSGTQAGQLYSYYDALDRLTTFTDYYRGTPRSITRADNTQVSYEIDENGWVKSFTNARGHTNYYQYNPVGRLTSIDRPSPWNDTSVTYTYSNGNLLQAATKGLEKTTTTYNAMLQPTKITREDLGGVLGSIQFTKTYDAMGREIFSSLPGLITYGKATTYDALGRVLTTKETAPGGGTTSYSYLAGNKVRVKDPMGNSITTTSSAYGSPSDGKTLKVEKPAGITTDFAYDIYGNLLSIAQAKGNGTNHVSSYIYDGRLRVCRVKIPEKGDTLYAYNDANEKIQFAEGVASGSVCETPPSSTRVTQTYDLVGRPLVTDYADSTPDISRSYDENGNLLSVNRNGVNWNYTYNIIDLPQTETLSLDGRTYGITNSYDNDGILTSKTYPSGQTYSYINDNFGRLHDIYTGEYFYLNNITYYPNGKINTLNLGIGGYYIQDLNNRQLTSSIHSSWGDVQYYYYDANARITQIDAVAYNQYDRTFGYDGAGRLTSATGPWGSAIYKYDTLNNITQKTEGSRVVDIQYNSSNRLFSMRDNAVGGNWRNYIYDTRGNVTNDGRYRFTYDLSNQPIAMTGIINSNFTYDGNLRRVKQIVGGETIYSIYDKAGALLTQHNITTNTKTDYLSVAGQTFVRIKNGVAFYPINDHLGTAYMEVDQYGTVEGDKVYNYTPFGETTNYVPFGSAGNDPGKKTEQGFTGHVEDKSGLTYMQARYYDPVIGRFLSTDPIGYEDGLNVYAYVGNDPVNNLDPTGMIKISLSLEAQLVVVGGAKASIGVYVDTKTLESGATIAGGPRIGLEAGAAIAVGVSESGNGPAATGLSNTATVDASVSAGVGYGKEILSESGAINSATEGNSGSGSVDIGKAGLSAGASIGVNFTGTASTDALKQASDTMDKATRATGEMQGKAAAAINQAVQSCTAARACK